MNVGNESTKNGDLLLAFHNQFAENHNHRQGVYVKILIASLTVFSCYGVVLNETLTNKAYDEIILHIATIMVVIVMTFLCSVLISQGWSFRSSQKIVNYIREYCLDEKCFRFFENFGKTTDSLPVFYQINLVFCEIIKIYVIGLTLYIQKPESKFFKVYAGCLVLSFIFEFVLYLCGYKKVQKNNLPKLKCIKCGCELDAEKALCVDCAKKEYFK